MGQNLAGGGRVGRGITDAVYVDVDGTLLLWPTVQGSPRPEEVRNAQDKVLGRPHTPVMLPTINRRLVAELHRWYISRAAHGGKPLIVIWSMGGHDHAQLAADLCDFPKAMRVCCMPKPDMMVDDGAAIFFKKHPVTLPDLFTCPKE